MEWQWAQTHNTDIRIAEAIADLAEGDTNVAERIWQEPTDEEIIVIWERATGNGLHDDEDMQWGKTTLYRMKTQYYDTKKLPAPLEQMKFLGHGDSNWDYFKHPTMDWVFSVAKVAGCATSSFGDMAYYEQSKTWRS